jgi:hypothetical protein
MRFVRGQPNHIDLGIIGMRQANIAQNLIADNPDLSTPDQQTTLMQMIDRETPLLQFKKWQMCLSVNRAIWCHLS